MCIYVLSDACFDTSEEMLLKIVCMCVCVCVQVEQLTLLQQVFTRVHVSVTCLELRVLLCPSKY